MVRNGATYLALNLNELPDIVDGNLDLWRDNGEGPVEWEVVVVGQFHQLDDGPPEFAGEHGGYGADVSVYLCGGQFGYSALGPVARSGSLRPAGHCPGIN